MSVGTKIEMYAECFYVKKMSVAEIAREFGVHEATVRKELIRRNKDAYRKEREERLQTSRQKNNPPKRQKKIKRKKEYIQEENDNYNWLLRHFNRVFPVKKKKGFSDAELGQFCMSQSGYREVLKDPGATPDAKRMARAAMKRISPPVVIIEHIPPGCTKTGKDGGSLNRTIRISLLK